ncbi:MAG: TadE/TadG family type IV pilus assembly protein [Pirellulaceae bacterium]
MRRSPPCALREGRRGVAAVELAVLLPFLCFVFVATVDFSRIFYYSVTISNCARNGAAYGSADQTRARDTAGIQSAAMADAHFNLDPQRLSVSSLTDEAASRVQVTVNYEFTSITRYPGIPRQTNLSRTVHMDVVPQTPTF